MDWPFLPIINTALIKFIGQI